MRIKKRIILLILFIIFLLIANSCSYSRNLWKDIAFSKPTKSYGIEVTMGYVAEGLYSDFFSIDFKDFLNNVSKEEIPLELINNYTTAKINEENGYSDFLNYESHYKDSWFGVMIIKDTEKARNWLLEDVENVYSFKKESLATLLKADQAVIYSLSRRGIDQEPTWTLLNDLSYFDFDSLIVEQVFSNNYMWTKFEGVIHTKSALTNPNLTDMSSLFSFRFYTGLPNETLLSEVNPWHPVEIIGRTYMTYINTMKGGVFVKVYYNGARFQKNNGEYVTTWKNPLIDEYEKMFNNLIIEVF